MKLCCQMSLLFQLLLAAQPVLMAPVTTAAIQHDSGKSLTMKTRRVSKPGLFKRQGINEPLHQGGQLYLVEVGIGNPYQTIDMVLDTGSSDTWVFPPNMCYTTPKCDHSYNSSNSSTFKQISKGDFSVRYVDQRWVDGDFFSDQVRFDGGSPVVLQMGLATGRGGPQIDWADGLLGLAFNNTQARVSWGQPAYPVFIDELIRQKVIDRPIFSLWLDNLKAPYGNIRFGAIDNTSFTGDLFYMPILPATGNDIARYQISLDGIGIIGKAPKGTRITVDLDSGTALTYLPQVMYKTIRSELPFEVDTFGYIDCKVPNGAVQFYFGNQSISVPFSELAIPMSSLNSGGVKPSESPDGDREICSFGLVPDGDSENSYILGDTFLRSAYVVYDFNSNKPQIGLAQARSNMTILSEA